MPTASTAKFSSPLGVYDFQKRSNIIQCSEESSKILAKHSKIIANAEGLFAHKESAMLRETEDKDNEK